MIESDKPSNAHKHAKSMKLYAEDAATTNKPWELWEYTYDPCEGWSESFSHPKWDENCIYRRKAVKPKTININGYEVPEPLQNAPYDGTMYWYPIIDNFEVSCSPYYCHYRTDINRLENGLVHLTQEAAQKHLEALLSFTRKK